MSQYQNCDHYQQLETRKTSIFNFYQNLKTTENTRLTIPSSRIQQQDEDITGGNTYDSVPPITANTDHLYANTQVVFKVDLEFVVG